MTNMICDKGLGLGIRGGTRNCCFCTELMSDSNPTLIYYCCPQTCSICSRDNRLPHII